MRHQRNAQYHGVKSNAPLTEMNSQTNILPELKDALVPRNMWMDCGRHVCEVCRGWGWSGGYLVFDRPLWQPMPTHVAGCQAVTT